MVNDNITADRDFVLGLLSLSIAATRLSRLNPAFEALLDAVAPSDAEVEGVLDDAMAQFNLIKEIG